MAQVRIYQRGKTWTARFEVGRDPTTRQRKQQTKGGFGTKREARQWLDDQRSRYTRGEFVAPNRQTYGEFLDTWLPIIRPTVRAASWESYERNLRLHVIPKLGGILLQQLRAEDLDRAYSELRTDGLSVTTVKHLHAIVHRSLKYAARRGKVVKNVASDVEKIASEGTGTAQCWTVDQLVTFLGQLDGDALYAPVFLAAHTGMRRGEVLGLRWQDIDLDAGTVQVRQALSAPRNPDTGRHETRFEAPKTAKGRRSIDLTDEAVTVLTRHWTDQLDVRDMVGAGYVDQGLVFTEPDGSLIHPERFARRFGYRVARTGLPRITFHGVRHTYATIQLKNGVHPKIVSETLGHANIAITLNTYSHVMPGMGKDAAKAFSAALAGARS